MSIQMASNRHGRQTSVTYLELECCFVKAYKILFWDLDLVQLSILQRVYRTSAKHHRDDSACYSRDVGRFLC